MANETGKDAAFTFNSQTYGLTDCLQSGGIDHAVNEVVFQCNGMDKGAAGTTSATFNVSLVLDQTDITKINALLPGTNASDFEAHPFGDTATYVEVTSSDATLISAPMSWSANGMVTMDVTIRLNQITIQAAS